MKYCPKCDTILKSECFSKASKRKDGLASACKDCSSEYGKRWYRRQLETQENFLEDRATKRRTYYEENKEQFRRHLLKQRYGMTLEEYWRLDELQNHECALCGKEELEKDLCVDHCHETGKIRGLLCGKCNRGIGMFGDNLEGVEKVVKYLKRSR